jgi:pimeloyl-ACP methyl ester carboxylesterase
VTAEETTIEPAGPAPVEPAQPKTRRRRRLRALLLGLGLLAGVVVVLNWTYGRLPGEPTPTGAFVNVDGMRIRYLEHPGAGVPVLLLHGLPGTAEDWERVTPLLSSHRTIAIDRPGFGYSTDGYVAFGRQLEVLHDLLRHFGIARAIVVGHSYGGTIALGYAERYPSDVAGLVLVDAAAEGKHLSGFERAQAHLVQILQAPVIRQIADVTFSQLFRKLAVESGDSKAFSPEPVAPAHRRRLLAINMTSENLRAFAGESLHADAAIDGVDRGLGAIGVPAVVVQGEGDKLVEAKFGKRLAASLPHARLVLLPGGHMQPYAHPESIAAAVEALTPRPRRPATHRNPAKP